VDHQKFQVEVVHLDHVENQWFRRKTCANITIVFTTEIIKTPNPVVINYLSPDVIETVCSTYCHSATSAPTKQSASNATSQSADAARI